MIEESGSKLIATAVLAGIAVALDTYGWTIVCATWGAYWALSRAETKSKGHAASCMLRWVFVSVIFSELFVALSVQHVGVKADWVQGPIAFLLAFFGDRWHEVPGALSRVIDRISMGRKQP